MNRIIILMTALICLILTPWDTDVAAAPIPYEAQLEKAQSLFKQKKFPEALAAVQAAGKAEPTRFEPPLLAALIFINGGQVAEARQALAEARKLAPATAQTKIDEIAKLVDKGAPATSSTLQSTSTTALTGAARRKYDTLLVIVEEADQAKSAAERRKLLDELLFKSGEFVRDFPDVLQVWTLRAAAGLELEQEQMTWEASSELIRLGAENSDDPKIRQLLAKLDRKGWLRTPQQMAAQKAEEERRLVAMKAAEERRLEEERLAKERRQAEAKAEEEPRLAIAKAAQEKWLSIAKAGQAKWQTLRDKGGENFLGMKFVPVPGTKVLFSVWETRVKDYRAYAQAKGVVDTSWQKPGFEQSEDHPVVNVTLEDAKAFCAWLSQMDGLVYRLPTDEEWSYAVGIGAREANVAPWYKNRKISGVYPWGTRWPPPQGAGNYGSKLGVDNYDKTAPVGSFAVNKVGLYDLGGNVDEWCGDEILPGAGSGLLRGGGWSHDYPEAMLSSCRYNIDLGGRRNGIGFRVVLVSVSAR